jgi:Uma2 family endonuclease
MFDPLTPEEYLAGEREGESKSEYLLGEIHAMSGGSPDHAAIALNIGASLHAQLKSKPFRAFSSDLKIATLDGELFAYPDLSVICGDLQFYEDHRDVVTNPIALVEVLSPSTEAFDRGKKFHHYRKIESLREYLLVAQDEPMIDHYFKREDGAWEVEGAYGLESEIVLPSLRIVLRLAETYEKIAFPPPSGPSRIDSDNKRN